MIKERIIKLLTDFKFTGDIKLKSYWKKSIRLIKKIKYFYIDIKWKIKNKDNELDGWKYYRPNVGYKEDAANFLRCILIPQIEYYIKYNPKGMDKFLEYLGSDKRFVRKYLYDKGLISN